MTRFPRYPVWSRGKSLHGWESCFHKNKRDDPLFDGRVTRTWLFPEKELEEVFFLAFPSFDFFLTYEFSRMPQISLPSSSFWYFISRSIFFPVKRSEASSSLSFRIRFSTYIILANCVSRIFELRTNEKIFGPYFLLQRFKFGEDRGRGREI